MTQKLFYKLMTGCYEFCMYLIDSLLDMYYYFKFSNFSNFPVLEKISKRRDENLSAAIIAYVHSIERAFSLKHTRKPFGIKLIKDLKKLISKVDDYKKFEYEMYIYNVALNEYNRFHGIPYEKNENSDVLPYKFYKHREISKESSFLEVVTSRHSIRNFGDEKVDITYIIKAIELAKEITPSVCNRQGWEVLLLKNQNLIQKVLKLQTGNSGIENIQYIIVICSTLTSFFYSNERHQPYIDGGIFLMALLNCLNYYNVASCTLNWEVNRFQDRKMKKLLNIDNSREIIALIGVGSYPKDTIKVASSFRKPLKKILKIVG